MSTLTILYKHILANASKALNLPAIEDETQKIALDCLQDLQTVHKRIIELSIFSPNETLEDISTQDLIYLTVPYVISEVQGRLKTTDRTERLNSLNQTEKDVQSFIELMDRYKIIPEEESALFNRQLADVVDYSKRRELKINQYKKEKELRARIEKIRKERRQTPVSEDTATDLDLLSSLLPSPSSAQNEAEELDSEVDEILRETILLLLRLLYIQSNTQLQSMKQELELLRNAPPSPIHSPAKDIEDPRDKQRQEDKELWKLDIPFPGGPDGKGPLLDPTGKPLRPFTILPSGAGERARFQSQVFGPSHRLPTMTTEEYLEIERHRGNIITGGGPASQSAPTSSEQLAIDAEMDGTTEGELKEEEKRKKDESWATYTDENPRGAGNTMNRG